MRRYSCLFAVLILAACATLLAQTAPPGETLNGYSLTFTHVVTGKLMDGSSFRTVIHVANPQNTDVRAIISFGQSFMMPLQDFTIAPGGSRSFEIVAEALRIGDVSVRATDRLDAHATIFRLRSPQDSQVLSQVSFPGQKTIAKVAVPVFRRAPIGGSDLVDDTGIAISVKQCRATLAFTLTDASGRIIARKTFNSACCGQPLVGENPIGLAFSMFVSEIFPNLPQDFSAGTLVIEALEQSPRMFTALAIYTRGAEMWYTPVTDLDVPREYLFSAKAGNIEQLAFELATQYGFKVLRVLSASSFAVILTTEEVARAVERDSRVLLVSGNGLVCID